MGRVGSPPSQLHSIQYRVVSRCRVDIQYYLSLFQCETDESEFCRGYRKKRKKTARVAWGLVANSRCREFKLKAQGRVPSLPSSTVLPASYRPTNQRQRVSHSLRESVSHVSVTKAAGFSFQNKRLGCHFLCWARLRLGSEPYKVQCPVRHF